MMKKAVEKCLGKIIVSCQAYQDTPLYGADNMKRMAECALQGGAEAVRCCWPQDIKAVRSIDSDFIIVGIDKTTSSEFSSMDDIFITPTFESAKKVVEAGADIIALDARLTKKRGKEELYKLLSEIHEAYPHIPVMADCSTYEDGMFAYETGLVDIVSTTLSGLVNKMDGPDIELLKKYKRDIPLPINAEGRIWDLNDLDLVKACNPDMITIGTAITRPHLITKRFIDHYNK